MRSASSLVLLICTLAAGSSAHAAVEAFLLKWGSFGSNDGQFNLPNGVTGDASGNVYVADTKNNRIQKFTGEGTFTLKWGSFGTSDGQFREPDRLALDASGNVYVVDTNNHRVQKFTGDGTFLVTWGYGVSTGEPSFQICTGGCRAGIPGSNAGQFNFPRGIAVDSDSNVYVSDTNNHRIQKFTSTGTYVFTWGSLGAGNGLFNTPIGVAVGAGNRIFVVDHANNRIQKFTSGGGYMTKWGAAVPPRQTPIGGQFTLPRGIAVDADDNVFVADTDNNRIQVFTNNGVYLTEWGTRGAGDGQFRFPNGIGVDGMGNVYVADRENHRVQKFGDESVPIIPTTWGRIKKLYR